MLGPFGSAAATPVISSPFPILRVERGGSEFAARFNYPNGLHGISGQRPKHALPECKLLPIRRPGRPPHIFIPVEPRHTRAGFGSGEGANKKGSLTLEAAPQE